MITQSSVIWLQVESVAFHPLDTQQGRAQVQLQLFLFGFQTPNALWPPAGTQELLYGETFAPRGGLFNFIVPYGEFGAISFRIVAHDSNNPEEVTCIEGPHGNQICLPSAPMSLSFVAALTHGQFRRVDGHPAVSDPLGRSTTMEGEKFRENFTLAFFAWADPPIAFSGSSGQQRLEAEPGELVKTY
jgi:hypothetical protein